MSDTPAGNSELPRITYNGAEWVVDLRQEEIRRAEAPDIRIAFADLPEGAVTQLADLIWKRGV